MRTVSFIDILALSLTSSPYLNALFSQSTAVTRWLGSGNGRGQF